MGADEVVADAAIAVTVTDGAVTGDDVAVVVTDAVPTTTMWNMFNS